MQKTYKVAIIGGGASGIISAIELSTKLGGENVAILERFDRIGKKILVTGASQGNLTNKNLSIENYYGEDATFAKNVLDSFDNVSLEKYLKGCGIYLTEKEDGKKYPLSYQASSVLDLFRIRLENLGTNILTGFFARGIKKVKDLFYITSENGEEIVAEKVILACGGMASKHLGTDGNGYDLAKSFSHTTTKLYPSLVQLKTDLNKIRGLKGLKSQVVVRAYDGNKMLKENRGEILFTEYGVSGSAVFQVSGHMAKAKEGYLEIEFLPELTSSQIKEILTERKNAMPYLKNEDLLTGLINKQIGRAVLKSCTGTSIEQIVKELKAFKIKIIGTLGFNYAQVTKGGISTKEIDDKTLESKKVKGLYFAGEIIDIDGDCGGYNLQWAFSSGIAVARAIIRENNGN